MKNPLTADETVDLLLESIHPISEGIAPILQKRLKTYFATLKPFTSTDNLHALVMQEVEKLLIQETLVFCEQNQSKAAEILGINRNTLRKKISQFSA